MYRVIGFIIIAIICVSCFKIDCEVIGERYREKYCNIVVRETPDSGRWFDIKGKNPVTGEMATYSDMGTWYVYFYTKIGIGDTIVKKQGELKFYIHKKDTVLVYPYECEGKIYN